MDLDPSAAACEVIQLIEHAAAASEAAPPRLMTADALLQLPTGMGERYELVQGELKIMSPAGSRHGKVVFRIAAVLGQF